MSEVKMVPAICTHCGGTVEVDPSKETGVCPFCGATYLIEKAVNNYNVQNAKIEHADHVHIDMSGTVNSVLDFVGKQMSENREIRREEKKRKAENERVMISGFFKVFGLMTVLAVAAFLIMNIFDIGDDALDDLDEAEVFDVGTGDAYYDIEQGCLSVSIPRPGEYTWELDDYDTTAVLRDVYDTDGYTFVFTGPEDMEEGEIFAVLQEYSLEDVDPVGYLVYRAAVRDWQVTEVLDSAFVADVNDYDFSK